MSYRVIKNNQVGFQDEAYKIPLVSAEGLKMDRNSGNDEDQEDSVEDSSIQGSQIIKDAQEKAARIMEKANKEAKNLQEKAYKKGYQKGYDEGIAQGKQEGYQQGYENALKETQEIKNQAQDLLQQAHRESRDYIEKTREEIIELAAIMAKNIIHYSIDLRDETIVEMVSNVLESVKERKQIVLRCHPDSGLLMETNLNQFKKICPNATFTIFLDKGMKDRGCVIETEAQIINLEIDQQLKNIKKALMEMGQSHEL